MGTGSLPNLQFVPARLASGSFLHIMGRQLHRANVVSIGSPRKSNKKKSFSGHPNDADGTERAAIRVKVQLVHTSLAVHTSLTKD
jgi:hypothetical protein